MMEKKAEGCIGYRGSVVMESQDGDVEMKNSIQG